MKYVLLSVLYKTKRYAHQIILKNLRGTFILLLRSGQWETIFRPLLPEVLYYLAVTMGLEFSGNRTSRQLFHLEAV